MSRTTYLLSVPWHCTNGRHGLLEIDVRTLGFLSVAELRADPDCNRYIDDLVDREIRDKMKR